MLVRCVLAALAALLSATPALAQTFSNATPITIPDSGPANPYASTINVSGISSPQAIRITLNGLTHSNTADLDILLLAPDSTKILLLSDIGSTNPATRATTNTSLSFEYRRFVATEPGNVPVPIVSGIYSPTADTTSDTFPVPAPVGPYTGLLQTPVLNNTCNGVWTLFVLDDTAGNSGSIAGGWTITFDPPNPAGPPTAFTFQGSLKSAGSPYSGNADFVFTLFDSATGGNPVGVPITTLSPVANGLVTATLDFGAPAFETSARWLDIQVRAPAGAGSFTTLSPRQAVTPAPLAITALSLTAPGGSLAPAMSVGGADPSYIGIGTTNPLRPLHISSPVGGLPPLLISAVTPGFQLTGASQSWNTFVTGTDLWIATTTTDGGTSTGRIIMKSNGNIGMGTASPTTALQVVGTITGTAKNFCIDHPLDPANKNLVHGCVESSEYKNIYDGTITTDARGLATVTLPSWFSALNENFHYQLTVLDESDQPESILWAKVVHKINDNQFTIRTSRPNLEVSWQVTGVRKDAYVKANPLVVEQDKPEKGKYLHPELLTQGR